MGGQKDVLRPDTEAVGDMSLMLILEEGSGRDGPLLGKVGSTHRP